ncbi:MAG: beta-propeller fold lactonase family protein [Spirochaetaceae bacterium]|nr:beta-propeller fold lactonase family protein [Spirochaetaceae bacterium]
MKKKNYLYLFISLFLLSTLFISCDSNKVQTSSIKISIEEGSSSDIKKTIVPEGTSLDITKYRIVCMDDTGPAIDTYITGNSYTVKDLHTGDWLIIVTAINKDNIMLLKNEQSINLTSLPAAIRIDLKTFFGNGDISMEYTWDADKIKDPNIKIQLTNSEGKSLIKEPTTINYTEGIATYEELVKAGSYTLMAQLFDNNTKVAGSIEAIEIINTRVSESTTRFNLDENSSITEKNIPLIINNKAGTPISCIITNVDSIIKLNSIIKPILVSKDNTPLTDYDLSWYLDGSLIGSGNNTSFKPNLGKHRLDVIVNNKNLSGSTSSCNFNFEVASDSPYYVPTIVNTIINNQGGIKIARGMDICFLPDNKFLLYNGSDSSLQICRIINTQIEVIKTYKSTSVMPLTRVNDIKVDYNSSKVFITEEATSSITAYDYSYNNLTPLYSDDTYSNRATNMGNIIIRDYDIFVDDPTSLYFRQYLLNPENEEQQATFAISSSYNKNLGNFLNTTASISPDKYGLCRTSSNGLVSFGSICKGIDDLRIIPFAIKGPIFPMNDNLNGVALSWNKFIVSSYNKLSVYKVPNENITSYELKNEYKGGINGIPKFNSVADFTFYTSNSKIDAKPIVDKLYVFTKDSNELLTFDVNEEDETLTLLGKSDLGSFIPKEAAISPNQEYMVVVSNEGNQLKLLKIRSEN